MFNVKFADIGEGIHEGVLLKLFVNVGDEVAEGQDLFTLETDKVNAEIPSPVSGKVTNIDFKVGDQVYVGDTIVIIEDGLAGVRSNMSMAGESTEAGVMTAGTEVSDQSEPVAEAKGASVVGQIEVSSEVIPSSVEMVQKADAVQHRKVLATPVARKLAKDLGVDIKAVPGTGPNGRVMKADIKNFANKPSAPESAMTRAQKATSTTAHTKEQVSGAQIIRVPMSMHRKTIAENMTKSRFNIPHTTVMDEVDVSKLVAFKKETAELASAEGVHLTYLAFFVKAVVLGLKAFPYLNAEIDVAKDEILLKEDYHIGIAVDTKAGLMVPVIRHADRLSIFEIAKEIERLSKGSREKSLLIDELVGSTFSITNYGSVGSSFGVPIIKYPEAGILGVGAIQKKPIVIENEIVIREILPLSLSFDHRIIDGADAGRFVTYVKDLLSNPRKLMLK